MTRIEFTVPAVPVAQPRPRATNVGKTHARMYEAESDHPVHTFKALVKLVARDALADGKPLTGPLSAMMRFVFPRLSSARKGTGRVIKSTRPDLDNLAKSVLDSLNNLAYKDDGQVQHLTIEKLHAGPDEQPSVWVCIEEIVF